jgi:hypothetical protein
VAEPAGKIITVNEPGKPAQKCRLIKMWTQPNGGKACQVQAIANGEMMTIVQSEPATGTGKTLAMTIYHWSGSTPNPEAPLPPMTMETTPPVHAKAAAFVQEAAPMPTGRPVVATPANVSSVFVPQQNRVPTGVPVGTTPGAASSVFVPQHGPMPPGPPMLATPQRAPGPMTPGGVVLTPAGSDHDSGSSSSCGDCGASGDCGTCCRTSLLERIKSCFKKDCDASCCPDSCTTSTPTSTMPAKTAAGETIVPVPTATTPVRPKETATKPVTGLFQRSKPVEVQTTTTARTESLDGTPHADDQKADPLKNPVAYSRTTAELAGAPAPKADVPVLKAAAPKAEAPVLKAAAPKAETPVVKAAARQAEAPVVKAGAPQVEAPMISMPMVTKGQIPLGTASVVAAGDPQYIPVPIVTLPSPSSPMPVTQVPQAPQLNQPMLANAFHQGGAAMAPPSMSGQMPANAFGASVAGNYGAPGYVPPGYGGTAYGQPLPAMPMGPAIQPGFYGPPRGQMVAPAGYYPMPPNPEMLRPMMLPPAADGDVDVQSLLNQLRDSMLPSQREWAATQLADLEWRKIPQVVDAMVQAAKHDPAASVRAGCIHCLAKMNVATPPVIAVIQSLKTDADPRVHREATAALAKLAPGQAPAMMNDPAVLPAGGLLAPPPRSN